MKLKEIEKKAKGKSRPRPGYSGSRLNFGSSKTRQGALKRRAPGRAPNIRDINEDAPDPFTGGEPPEDPRDEAEPAPVRPFGGFRPVIIKGGKADT